MEKTKRSLKNINKEIKYLEKLRDKVSATEGVNTNKRAKHRNKHLKWQSLALKCPHLRGVNQFAIIIFLATNFEFNKRKACRSTDLLVHTGSLNYLTKTQIEGVYSGHLSDLSILTEKDKDDFNNRSEKGLSVGLDKAARNMNKYLKELKDNGFIKIEERKARRKSSKGAIINYCTLCFPNKK